MSENEVVVENHPLEYEPAQESTKPEPEPSPTELLLKEKSEIEGKLKDFETRQRIAETKGVRPLSTKMDAREWAKTRDLQIAHGVTLDAAEGEKLRQELDKLQGKLTQQAPTRDAQGRFTSQDAPPLTPDPNAYQAEIQRYVAKCEEIAANREDAEELGERAKGVPVTWELHNSVLALGNPEIAWHLAEHLDLVAKLNQLSGPKLAAELGRIEATMDDESTAKAKPPKPPTPTGRNPTKTSRSVYDEDLPFKEYVKLRNAQEQKSNRLLY